MRQVGRCRAHTNIALIKYWGKRNDELFLPMNSSLSLTLDAFYTDTEVVLDSDFTSDTFFLNDVKQDEKETEKITKFLNLFRNEVNMETKACVKSYNHVPTAAGLASSASAFSALAGAMNQASGLNLDSKTLSTFARRGSGSATRSIYGGFVEWYMGEDDLSETSHAIPVDDASWDIGMIVIAVNTGRKKLSSRVGMKQTIATSPFYSSWVETATSDLTKMKDAIKQKDFITLGEITESNGMKMHATMLGAFPPISYWEPDSVKAIQTVKEIRGMGIPCYVTMDAGPNVKVLCKASDMAKIEELLLKEFKREQIIPTTVGEGIKLLSDSEWNY
ncbi:diphosphomevalonate decarboxylase [Vagococcus fluvialis]|uniref:diphosphomevalonate decarboxylase n=1 Tax=Vagococcus fluvialis TaxID=2738 RepID=UPI001432D5AC|nr:diphosphomevalonate decarboxylase [Vagococcus fluvialis]MBO0443616.1 diphosphomevalonate decarboxylase [Vagococcus fluvialis]MBO0480056.1 diphosphomevalonate decarboxylase [Vagococcus fluvialis]MBO0483160.1 diphosphomevalonate decarboxylase [Vagococcus fluvialis]NKC58602.1 diphosphomevalonate decarboxylase [Vagococcus fluvialis]NKD49166.1 diphosphomevalonate decarboxylase [Vagococcus fluvialis]